MEPSIRPPPEHEGIDAIGRRTETSFVMSGKHAMHATWRHHDGEWKIRYRSRYRASVSETEGGGGCCGGGDTD